MELVEGQSLDRHLARVDSRSDLLALGVVLYELAAGRRLFAGASWRIVGRCLEKQRARRVQTAPDVRNELELA